MPQCTSAKENKTSDNEGVKDLTQEKVSVHPGKDNYTKDVIKVNKIIIGIGELNEEFWKLYSLKN